MNICFFQDGWANLYKNCGENEEQTNEGNHSIVNIYKTEKYILAPFMEILQQ